MSLTSRLQSMAVNSAGVVFNNSATSLALEHIELTHLYMTYVKNVSEQRLAVYALKSLECKYDMIYEPKTKQYHKDMRGST